jgi:hypothetical protein
MPSRRASKTSNAGCERPAAATDRRAYPLLRVRRSIPPMTRPPEADVLDPDGVAAWLDVEVAWVLKAVADEGMPMLGRRADGTPLMAVDEIRTWLRRSSPADDET